jgi:hypothetical protein
MRVRVAMLCLVAAAALATDPARAEGQIYKWLGQDGRVQYTSSPPPPNAVLLEVTPAAGAPPAPAPKSPAPAKRAPRPPRASSPAAAAAESGDSCARFQYHVDRWRKARRYVESAEAEIDRLQSDTSNIVRSSDSYREWRMERAEERLASAEAHLDEVEDEARQSSVPQRCLSD